MHSLRRFFESRDLWAWFGLNQWTGLLLHDDTGALVPIRDTARHPPVLGWKKQQEATPREDNALARWRRRLMPVWVVFLLLLLAEFVVVSRHGQSLVYTLGSIYLLAYLVSVVLRRLRLVRLNRRARQQTTRGEYEYEPIIKSLCENACPCCGYGMDGVPEDDLGVARCPECGSGWKRRLWARDWPVIAVPPWNRDRTRRTQWTIMDGRKREVRLLADLCSHDAQSLRRDTRRRPWIRSLLLTSALPVCLVGFISLLAWTDPRPTFQAAFFRMTIPGVFFFAPILIPFVFWLRKADSERWKASLARYRLDKHQCPSCGDVLDLTPSKIDGLTVCRGCGSAWRPPSAEPATLTA